jgi:hypothetical protein
MMLKVGRRSAALIKARALGLVGLWLPLFLCANATASSVPVYGTPTPVAELNTTSIDRVSQVSFDGLTLLLFRQEPSTQFDLFISTRASTSDPWSTPSSSIFDAANSTHFNVGGGLLSQDKLELFYGFGDNPIGNTGFIRATRASTSDPFPAGSIVPGVNLGSDRFHDPEWLSPDGLRLYFRWRNTGVGALYMVERPTTSSAFGAPTASPFVNINMGDTNQATLTPDERQIIFTSGSDLWWAERPDRFSAFGTPVPLSSVNSPLGQADPELFDNTLYFVRNGDIYSAPQIAVPEPSSLTLLCIGVGVLGCARRRCHQSRH